MNGRLGFVDDSVSVPTLEAHHPVCRNVFLVVYMVSRRWLDIGLPFTNPFYGVSYAILSCLGMRELLIVLRPFISLASRVESSLVNKQADVRSIHCHQCIILGTVVKVLQKKCACAVHVSIFDFYDPPTRDIRNSCS